MKKTKKLNQGETDLPKTQSTTQVVINVKPPCEENVDSLPGYEQEDYVIPHTGPRSVCWNCCHEIHGQCSAQPIHYDKGVFTTVGHFCSAPCISRYIIDSNISTEMVFSRLALLNLYINIQHETKGLTVTPAPPKIVLEMFGGSMTIEDYRQNHKEYLTVATIDPIVRCIDMTIKDIHIKKQNMNDNMKEFKLYRKHKKTNQNDIYASMKLMEGS
jgi:hypothetical protein